MDYEKTLLMLQAALKEAEKLRRIPGAERHASDIVWWLEAAVALVEKQDRQLAATV